MSEYQIEIFNEMYNTYDEYLVKVIENELKLETLDKTPLPNKIYYNMEFKRFTFTETDVHIDHKNIAEYFSKKYKKTGGFRKKKIKKSKKSIRRKRNQTRRRRRN
jgi:hypothetical protein